ncbi:MAG: bifunctional DNA-formamidopyrimidine glycosylase/DNA-(apurinic or apyrimidinic site) lyase [Succinivibrio sp.]|jgi:formamidopyrimidine-DNA glycosylase|nr:bifunctional DNA-formamidopyrimidine glycosylase/DNA-(apurinic or apyrimidinic site) lyase [Succinivibrio sp.]
MPELPEVEVTMRGVRPVLEGEVIEDLWHDDKKLREPFSPRLNELIGAKVANVSRRAKFILVGTDKGTLLVHLGMTGHLSILRSPGERLKHDHFELTMGSGIVIRYNDARRFGLVAFIPPDTDPLLSDYLKDLGPEPLSDAFTPKVLYEGLQRHKKSVKQAIMDASVVVGVGNIYASEVLFLSKIRPDRRSDQLSFEECRVLRENIRSVLALSISKGGTTIINFQNAEGKMGYFVQNLNVYGHKGEKCPVCGTPIEEMTLGQRSTYFCPRCQK